MPGKRGQRSAKAVVLAPEYTVDFLQTLDGRSRVARELNARAAAMMADLGGEATLSYARRSLVRRAIHLEARIEALEAGLAAGVDLDPVRYTALVNTLLGLLRALGLKREARNVTLNDYIHGRPA